MKFVFNNGFELHISSASSFCCGIKILIKSCEIVLVSKILVAYIWWLI